MNYFLLALKKYADFNGRATRSEYWFFELFCSIFYVILFFIDVGTWTFDETLSMGLLSGLFMLAMIVPSISVTTRRLHDTGHSGWMQLLLLIPLVWSIWILVLMILDSEPKDNKYGKNPKKVK